ncbi:hypothetical protein [Nocardia lasii]|uniref:Uncharacterized protein n=1 Tax=Nocardia lasii TaxID=1616107 RepID=A0ABW1JWK4_9NOCA
MVADSYSALRVRVSRLRESLRTAQDFAVPWGYFHDELATRADFMGVGEAGESALIEAGLARIAKSRGWPRPSAGQPTVHIPELMFWHGFRTFGPKSGIFFYDEHTCQGLLGVMTGLGGPVDLFRFSTVALPARS